MQRVVEFDREALELAMQNGLDINDSKNSKQIDDLKVQSITEEMVEQKRDEIYKEVSSENGTMNLAAIGAKYDIGPLKIQNVLGNLVLLAEIDSPLAGDLKQGEEISYDDCVKAIYVLSEGRKVLTEIMEIDQRVQDLIMLKDLCGNNPEMINKIIDRVELISDARIRFLDAAREFYEKNFVGFDFGDIVNSIMNMMIDTMKAAQDNPTSKDGKKKI